MASHAGGENDAAALELECQMYEAHLAAIGVGDSTGANSNEIAEAACKRLRDEEALLHGKLTLIQREKDMYEATKQMLRNDAGALGRQEQQYWHEYNAFCMQREGYEEERDFVQNCSKRLAEQDEQLRSTNVYNDSFYIWHDGSFGTINGFRLGRLPNQQVEWSEINAAWGQIVLLLHTMASQKNFAFQNHRLIPMGSFSEIMEGQSVMQLYGSASWFSSFDRAMIAFLQCLKEFGEYAESTDSSLKLPYHIEGDKIGVLGKPDKWYAIKRRFNPEEKWTNALKYMLTNLKWLVAWLCRSA
jgi:beclin 1